MHLISPAVQGGGIISLIVTRSLSLAHCHSLIVTRSLAVSSTMPVPVVWVAMLILGGLMLMNRRLKLRELRGRQNLANLQLLCQTQFEKLALQAVHLLVHTTRTGHIDCISSIQVRQFVPELMDLRDQHTGLCMGGALQSRELLLLHGTEIERCRLRVHEARCCQIPCEKRADLSQ
jgi:hypothetical protein